MLSKIKLGLININGCLKVRDINEYKVTEYREALKAGAIFPPMIIDSKTYDLISGFHRYETYKREIGLNSEVEVDLKDFNNDQERLLFAISENSKNGLPFSGYERRQVFIKAEELGIPLQDISKALCVTINILEKWKGEEGIKMTSTGVQERVALKRSVREQYKGKVIPDSIQDKMDRRYDGHTILFHVDRLIDHLKDNTIDKKDEEILEKLKLLQSEIERFLD